MTDIHVSDVVEDVVRELNRLGRVATINFAVSVGQLVIDKLYGGDVRRWRTRSPRKDYSLRKLAAHPRLPMSAPVLYRSIAMFEICERLDITSWRHVSTSHLRLVLPLPPAEQDRLLRQTESNRWTTERLHVEIVSVVRSAPEMRIRRGGRPRETALRHWLRSITRLLEAVEQMDCPDVGDTGEASPESARDAVEVLRRTEQCCAIARERLAGRIGSASDGCNRPGRPSE